MGLVIPEQITICRTRAGRHQKSVGAWSWYLVDGEGGDLGIGSAWPATDIVRSRTISWYVSPQCTGDVVLFPHTKHFSL